MPASEERKHVAASEDVVRQAVAITSEQVTAVRQVVREVVALSPRESADTAAPARSDVAAVRDVLRQVVTVGAAGPAGPQGQPGSDASPKFSVLNVSGVELRRGTPVFLLSDGTVVKADAVTNIKAVGFVADETIPAGAYGFVQVAGMLDATIGDWEQATNLVGGLTPGATYYLATTAGRITATPDVNSAVIGLGKALTASRMHINIAPPVL